MAATEIIEVRVELDKLQSGMYVCRLDRPWLETPFEMQGFEIRGEEDIVALTAHCQYVYIDDVRSVHIRRETRPSYVELSRMSESEPLTRLERMGYQNMRGPEREVLPAIDYPVAVTLAKELPRARKDWQSAHDWMEGAIERATRGEKLALESLGAIVDDVVESVVRSPDAALWLAAIRRQEPYSISHPLNCCAMVLVFARFLGFPPAILKSMARGALLMDIGMWRLGEDFYAKTDAAADAAKDRIREHVLRGLEFLEESSFSDPDAKLMILHHHERVDGAGYPRAIGGDKISLMGHMLNVVDTLDALCSKRSYRDEDTIGGAQRILYKEREQACPAEVVETLFQSLGVYPTGSLVELSNGAVAAVSGQSPSSRLYPRLIFLTNPDKTLREEFEEIDSNKLFKQVESVKILRSVPQGSVDIRLDQVEPKVAPELAFSELSAKLSGA